MLTYRKNIILFLLIGLSVQACNNNDEDTALKGSWLSECIKPVGFIPDGGPGASHKVMVKFGETDVTYSINKYSDASCNNYTANLAAEKSPHFFAVDKIPDSYTVGSTVKTNNGTEATQVLFTANGNVSSHIYQIENDDKLYFGELCGNDATDAVFNIHMCHSGLSRDINYEMAYLKID